LPSLVFVKGVIFVTGVIFLVFRKDPSYHHLLHIEHLFVLVEFANGPLSL
ncbi:Hypothetical protein FKW44_020196, partial [Caligus rogercresseyi]